MLVVGHHHNGINGQLLPTMTVNGAHLEPVSESHSLDSVDYSDPMEHSSISLGQNTTEKCKVMDLSQEKLNGHLLDTTTHSNGVDLHKHVQNPQYWSTPTTESSPVTRISDGDSSSHMSRKAKRMSRLCVDQSFGDCFDTLEVDALLLAYLVRHGALTEEMSQLISITEPTKQKSTLLMALGLCSTGDCVVNSTLITSSPVFGLLLNALRYCGQHSLASSLDCGRRITPYNNPHEAQKLGNSDVSIKRRRGQLSLWICLDAIKIDPSVYRDVVQQNNNAHTSETSSYSAASILHTPVKSTSKEDVRGFNPMLPSFVEYLGASPMQQTMTSSSSKSLWIDHTQPIVEAPSLPPVEPLPSPRKTGCFSKLRCILIPRRRRKPRPNESTTLAMATQPQAVPIRHPVDYFIPIPAVTNRSKSDSSSPPVVPSSVTSSAKLALLDHKSCEFYNILASPDTQLHDAVVKYLEQLCGVLVMDVLVTKTEKTNSPCVSIVLVATQAALVQRLSDSCTPRLSDTTSPLQTGLTEAVIRQGGMLNLLQIQDLRLSVGLIPSEVTLAIEELCDMIE